MPPFQCPDELQHLVDILVFEARRPRSAHLSELAPTLNSLWAAPFGLEEYGLLLRFDDPALDPDVDDVTCSEFATQLSPARLKELRGGASLSSLELARWRDLNVEAKFENPDSPVWQIVPIVGRTGDRAFVAQIVTGDSWSGLEVEFLGVFRTASDAKRAVQEVGYVSLEDFRLHNPGSAGAGEKSERRLSTHRSGR